jgi:hypothetical protein
MIELREADPSKRGNDCVLLVHPFYMRVKLMCSIGKLFSNLRTQSESASVSFVRRLTETLHQRCPTFLYIGARLTDDCGGAGAVWRLQ